MKILEAKTGEIMPKEPDAAEEAETKKIRAVTRGWITDKVLASLRDAFKDITVTDAAGYKTCVKAIATLRKYRTTLEKSRMEKNRGDHEKITLRNKEAKRITAILVEIESPLKEMKRVKDERDAKEKAEKERVEKERVDAIKQRMEDNFGQHQIDDLAGKPSGYMEARMRIIEAYEIDDAYQEFKDQTVLLQRGLLARINNIFLAKRQHEQADKLLQAEKAKLDEEKQRMADQEKRLQEQQEEFEKERAEWRKKRENAEKAQTQDGAQAETQAEADTGETDDEAATDDERVRADTDFAETQTQAAVSSNIGVSLNILAKEEAPNILDQEQDPLGDDKESCIYSLAEQATRQGVVESIWALTGIDDFNDNDLTDLLSLAQGMYLSPRYEAPIRHLAKLVREEELLKAID